MPFSAIAVILVLVLQVQVSECLDCFKCSNLQNVTDCLTLTVCQANEECSIVSNGTGDNIRYNLGCRHKDQCPKFSQLTTVPSVPIVGRDLSSLPCDNCCADDYCNKRMCPQFQTHNPNECADDQAFNCAQVANVFNICADPHHAQTVCRKFCGICSLVDGLWSNWTPWTSCDITCGNGTISRVRMCDNPTPANGGLPCSGAKKEQRQCTMSPCPVHGGWSSWTGWASCTTSCGAGLQKKTRTCSNPPPSRFGDHCFGDSTDFKSCFEQPCAGTSTVQHVAFSVYAPSSQLKDTYIPVSWSMITNIGGGFNTTTGKFTCSIKGLYTFSVTVSAGSYSAGTAAVQCNVYHDNVQGQPISTNPRAIAYTISGVNNKASTTTHLELSVGDTVYLHCGNWAYVHAYDTQFSGALI